MNSRRESNCKSPAAGAEGSGSGCVPDVGLPGLLGAVTSFPVDVSARESNIGGFLTRHPLALARGSRRPWSGLQGVIGDLDGDSAAQAPVRWHLANDDCTTLTCGDASQGHPQTTHPGEKTSVLITAPMLPCRPGWVTAQSPWPLGDAAMA